MTKRIRKSALFRAGLFWTGYLVFVLASIFVAANLGLGRNHAAGQWCYGLSLLAFALFWTRFCLRLEGRRQSAASFDISGATVRTCAGLGIGLAIMGACYLSLPRLVHGLSYAWASPRNAYAIPASIALFLLLSAAEELGFRGYPMRRLLEAFGVWPTQLIVAIMFCIYHIAIGWDWRNAIAGTILASFLFGMAAIVSPRDLALAIGVHAGVNIATWSIGGEGGTGLWKVVLDPSLANQAQIMGRVAYAAFTLVGIAALWIWGRKDRHHENRTPDF
jgi:membrane protease YdiL (CAAX protease family)